MGCLDKCQFIIFIQFDRNLAVSVDAVEFLDRRLLDNAFLCRKEQEACLVVVCIRDKRLDLFCSVHLNQVDDRNSLAGTAEFRNMEAPDTENSSGIRKDEEVVMCGHGDELVNDIILVQFHTLDSLAAAVLHAVVIGCHALDISVGGEGNDNILHGDQIFVFHICRSIDDFASSRICELIFDLKEFFLDDCLDSFVMRENILIICDLFKEFRIFPLNSFSFQSGEPSKLHIENGLSLDFIEIEAVHKPRHGFIGILGIPDCMNDCIEVIHRNAQSFEDMGSVLCFL